MTLTTKETLVYLGKPTKNGKIPMAKGTLDRRIERGTGPKYTIVNGRRAFEISDLNKYLMGVVVYPETTCPNCGVKL